MAIREGPAAREPFRRRSSARLILEIDVGERLSDGT
jgi:hypothetical protein